MCISTGTQAKNRMENGSSEQQKSLRANEGRLQGGNIGMSVLVAQLKFMSIDYSLWST